MSDLLKAIAENVIQGRSDKQSPLVKEMEGEPGVKELTKKAINERIDVEDIISA